jgi:peroxiredoxin
LPQILFQWGKSLNLSNVKLIPDGSGDFTRRLGMLIKKEHLGFVQRSWRYAMVVKDGVIEKWFEEPSIDDEGTDQDPYGETSPEKVLNYLQTKRA